MHGPTVSPGALDRFVSFAGFGMLPVLGFVITGICFPALDQSASFVTACAITGMCLFFLGAFKAKFSDKRYVYSGLETLLLGGTCAYIAFVVGRAVSNFSGLQQLFQRLD